MKKQLLIKRIEDAIMARETTIMTSEMTCAFVELINHDDDILCCNVCYEKRKTVKAMVNHIFKDHDGDLNLQIESQREANKIFRQNFEKQEQEEYEAKLAEMQNPENIDPNACAEFTTVNGIIFRLAIIRDIGRKRSSSHRYAYVSSLMGKPHRMVTSMYSGGQTGNGVDNHGLYTYDPKTKTFENTYHFICFV